MKNTIEETIEEIRCAVIARDNANHNLAQVIHRSHVMIDELNEALDCVPNGLSLEACLGLEKLTAEDLGRDLTE